MTNIPSNSDDVIDSLNLITRLKELESDQDCGIWLDKEDWEELKTLRELTEEAEGYASDWKYGETLVRESYWVDYVREMLEDCGDIPRDLPSYIAIDWEQTAENIKVDYATVEFGGVDYYIRCS